MGNSNINATDNIHLFINTIKKYIIFLFLFTVMGTVIMSYTNISEGPQYSIEKQIKFNMNTLNELNCPPAELISSDELFKEIANLTDIQDMYKSINNLKNIDNKALQNWLKETIAVKQDFTDNNSIITVVVISKNNKQSETVAEAYYKSLDLLIKNIANQVYNSDIAYYDKKIKIIRKKLEDISSSSDINNLQAYSNAIDKWSDSQIKLNYYTSPLTLISTKETTIISDKKIIVKNVIIGAMSAFFIGIFLIFFIDYLRSFKNCMKGKNMK